MNIEFKDIELNNSDKIFFPSVQITKENLINYYYKISDTLLPYLKNRPLTLSRFPDGIDDNGFYQKQVSDYFPSWIDTVTVPKKEGGSNTQMICNNKKTLVYLVNQATLSFHPWLSTIHELEKPDTLIFDLDPPEEDFELAIKGAKILHSFLKEELSLHPFLMATGSQGLHVVCPIKQERNFDDVRAFVKGVGSFLTKNNTDVFTTEQRKDQRRGRLFIDYIRNSYAQTSIAPYSVRALEGAPVATPLEWDELDKPGLHSQSYNIKNIFKRLSKKEDPWVDFSKKAAKLNKGIKRLHKLSNEN